MGKANKMSQFMRERFSAARAIWLVLAVRSAKGSIGINHDDARLDLACACTQCGRLAHNV